MHVHEDHLEGIVAQIFHLGPSFHFMKKLENKVLKMSKSYPFFFLHKIKTKA